MTPQCPQCYASSRPTTPADGPDDDYISFPWCCDGCGILFYAETE